MRPYRAGLSARCLVKPALPRPNVSLSAAPALRAHPAWNASRQKSTDRPPDSYYSPKISQWSKYEELGDLSNAHKERVGRNPLDYIDRERRRLRGNAAVKKRMGVASFGLALVMLFQVGVVLTYGDELSSMTPEKDASPANTDRLDAPKGAPGFDGIVVAGVKPGPDGTKLDEAGNELLPTGSDSVPFIPRTIQLPVASGAVPPPSPSAALPASTATNPEEEYTLLGHGLRTISIFSIKVYVLGIYVRTSDIPQLHRALVRSISDSPSASALLPGEKDDLRSRLLDADGSRVIWNKVLRDADANVRFAVRVVPTRDTDFNHMRDGWITGITARTQEATRAAASQARAEGRAPQPTEFDDASFGQVIADFKGMFGGRGSLPKGSEVLLMRDERGGLAVSHKRAPKPGASMYTTERQEFGRIDDERLSRLVWQCYLAGPKVSSEPARKSVTDGLMGIAERPIGSVGITSG